MDTDVQPSTSSSRRESEDSLSPRKKRKLQPFSANEKLMIMNVYKHIYAEKETECPYEKPITNDYVQKTADILAIGRSTVYKVLKESKGNIEMTSPRKTGPKFNFEHKLDEFTMSAIRRKVHQFFYRNEPPTLDKVYQAISNDREIQKFSRSTLYKILKHLNFKYMTKKRRSIIIDREDIILWRHRYLQNIQQYRSEGRVIYYQDETWINEGHTESKHWVDRSVLSSRQAFLEGLSTGLRVPTGKGRRLIISHVGSEDGFVDGGLMIIESKKGLQVDYHKEMNSQLYENWLKVILPKLGANSVLVIDNAPYHSRKVESLPSSNWLKSRLQEWLTSKNISFQQTMLKAELLELARKVKKTHERFVVDEMAAEHGVTILRLPPYHCELNPIELVWAQVKGHVAKNNKSFKMTEVEKLFNEGLQLVTPQRWSDCISHVVKIENEMCNLGHVIDNMVEHFIIEVGSDSDASASYSSELGSESE